MAPYPGARLASYLSACPSSPRNTQTTQTLWVQASTVGPGVATIWVVWFKAPSPSSQHHGQSWPGTLGHNSRHLPTITISGSNAQPSRRCGDQQ